MSGFGILQLPIWGGYAIYQQEGNTFLEVKQMKHKYALLTSNVHVFICFHPQKLTAALQPSADWGPMNPDDNKRYQQYMSDIRKAAALRKRRNVLQRMFDNVFD